ncbi:unnamed protein product [Dibothriocephalus latus]|uniref:Uncharacterized protein n=1 Tax=Dibothriocephalus latus TaxID=60516 RepID=A0A3P7LBU7_DIBLA|nr:unnamed protein product [Dibothriocephalus latus]
MGVTNQSDGGKSNPQNADLSGNSWSKFSRACEKPKCGASSLVEDDDSASSETGTTVVFKSMGDTYRPIPPRLVISNEDYVPVETSTLDDSIISTEILEMSGEGSRTPVPVTVRIEVPSTRPNPPDNFRQINSDTLPAEEPNSSRVIGATTSVHTTTMQPTEGEDIEGLLFRGHSEISRKIDLDDVLRRGGSLVIKNMIPTVTLSDCYVPRDHVPGFTPVNTTISTTTVSEPLDEMECRHVVEVKTRDSQTQTAENSISTDLRRKQGARTVPLRQFAARPMKTSPSLKQGLLEQLIMETIQALNINRLRRN